MSKLELDSLGVGDIVQTRRTHKVIQADAYGLRIEDVRSGDSFYVGKTRDYGSLRVELVKKAKPQRQHFQVGDVVTSTELQETMWKRGTVVGRVSTTARYTEWALLGTGDWTSLTSGGKYGFERFDSEYGYKIIHLPS